MSVVSRGTRIGNETYDSIPASSQVRPLRDHIVIEPLGWKPSKVLEVVYWGKPLRGRVKATGPGTYPKLYDGPKGKRTRSWLAKSFRPCDVQVGDEVELGGLEIGGYLFQTFRWGNTEHIICQEADITGIIERESPE